jgi:hypothetical protein
MSFITYKNEDHGMDMNVARLTFLPAEDESLPACLVDVQRAARAIRQAGGTELIPAPQALNRGGLGFATVLMQYVLPVAQAVISPVVAAGVTAWLQGRANRKIRLKVGDLEVEAHTIEQVDQLLQRARELRREAEAKSDEA